VAIETPQHQQELILGEVKINECKSDCVKRQIPGGVPGVLPLIGHRDDVAIKHVEPLGIANLALQVAEERMTVVFLKPQVNVKVVKLLRPKHPSQRLPVDQSLVRTE
jgi:hypothetical protein